MPDTKEESTLEYLKDTVEKHNNHIVREDEELKGKVEIEARSDGDYNVVIHRGTSDKARRIEAVSKDRIIGMMESQL